MDFDFLLDLPVIDDILDFFDFRELFVLELVNKKFYSVINSEVVWRRAASRLFCGAVFVPNICLRLIHPGNDRSNRLDLKEMKISSLRALCQRYHIVLQPGMEKDEVLSLIHEREMRRSFPNECLARFAIRIAYLDRKRNCITHEELCQQPWCIRTRKDGPLAPLRIRDPYWQAEEAGKVHFCPTSRAVEFDFPEDLDPFAVFMFHLNPVSYMLENDGTMVRLSNGVPEMVCRHPQNWGWVLCSTGTVWTSFKMVKGDHYTEDENVEDLLTVKNAGFEI